MQLIDRLTKQLTTVNDATIAQLQGPTKQQLHGTSTRLRSAQDVIAQEIKGFMDSTHPAGTSCGAGGVGMDDALVVAVNRVRYVQCMLVQNSGALYMCCVCATLVVLHLTSYCSCTAVLQ